MLIVFEGGEGSGKGTQIKLLENYLKSKNKDVLCIIEPGGTNVGQAIRDILLNRHDFELDGLTESLLFSASRSYQINNVTKPALKSGKIVLSDRSFYSTYAYQGYGRNNDLPLLEKLTKIATNNLVPDLVIYLDIDPEVGISRKVQQKEINRLDKESLIFHKRVQKGYLELAEKYDFKVIDATASIQQIHNEIISILEGLKVV